MTRGRLRPGDVLAFLGPSLPPHEARRLGPCRVLPPARAGDVLAALPARPLAIALVDGLFDTTPSVWHRELLAALDAGVAVFGGGSMGALRAAELERFGVVGVGRVFGWYRDGAVVDDGEVALLHADAEGGFRPLTLPLVQVRAAAEAARAAGRLTARGAAELLRAAAALPYAARAWPAVLRGAQLPRGAGEGLEPFLRAVPDVKAEDARSCLAAALAFARARRAGAPPPPRPPVPPASTHLRRLRLQRAGVQVAGEALPAGQVLAALGRRPTAGREAADGLRHLLLAAWARGLGLRPGADEVAGAERAWLRRLGVGAAGREAFLSACGLDEGAARALAEDLALEAALLARAAQVVPDGPGWEEGLALSARLSGAWVEEAARLATAGVRRRTRRKR
ncbi:MAG: TfuA-like protein [Anaeromyxobacter sp.]